MHISSSRCQALAESLQSMETLNALSGQMSTWRPSRRKYKVASQGNSIVRLLNVRTPSSAPGVTYNKTVWHIPSKHSSAVPTPALARLQSQYHAYIITLWKYHGHTGKGAQPRNGRPVRQYTRRKHDATARERTSHVKCPGGLYNELNTCFT